jgi:hypothetical protein
MPRDCRQHSRILARCGIVAELEAVRHDTAKEFSCGAQLLGPQHRLWSTASVLVNRVTPSCPLDLAVGQTVRFESVFMVPAQYADQLSGIALSDNSTAARTPVIDHRAEVEAASSHRRAPS